MSPAERAKKLYQDWKCQGDLQMLAALAFREVEQETLARALLAALSHKSPPVGEECPGCEAVAKLRALNSTGEGDSEK